MIWGRGGAMLMSPHLWLYTASVQDKHENHGTDDISPKHPLLLVSLLSLSTTVHHLPALTLGWEEEGQ